MQLSSAVATNHVCSVCVSGWGGGGDGGAYCSSKGLEKPVLNARFLTLITSSRGSWLGVAPVGAAELATASLEAAAEFSGRDAALAAAISCEE